MSTPARVRVVSVVGARPQLVKAAALARAIAATVPGVVNVENTLVHTGQHYDFEMSGVFFSQLGLPDPDYHLGVGSESHGRQTGAMLDRVEQVLLAVGPDLVLVYGDTNSTLAGALAAAKLNIPVAHVEAGLRSYRRDMPEEVNRLVTDHLSTLLFCPSDRAVANLAREGIEGDHVQQVGDVMLEVLRWQMSLQDSTPAVLDELGLTPGQFALVTVHRPENADQPGNLGAIVEALNRIQREGVQVVFPVHPRTRPQLDVAPLDAGVKLLPPQGYREIVALTANARVVLTDSGGLQKEAFWLGVPTVTLRTETEWPETLQDGWNSVAGTDPERIVDLALRRRPDADPSPAYGTGDASSRILAGIACWWHETG